MTSGAGVTPVLYAGQDLACALAETVFHDLSDDRSVPQEILQSDLPTLRAGTITTMTDLSLADLRDAALAGYGATRAALVDTPPESYPTTRLWAQHVWDTTALSGLVWSSRRSVGRLSFLLFVRPADGTGRGARRRLDIDVADAPVPLWDGPGLAAVLSAAAAANVTVVLP